MKRNMVLVNSSRCIGCFGCEIACKLEHDLPPEPRLIRVIRSGPHQNNGSLLMSYHPVACFHCDYPSCVSACPTGAMQKRPDGIVFSEPDLCIGCRTCAAACPFGVPQLNPATGKIAKCNGCMERVDQGLWPSCALICPTDALVFGTPADAVRESRITEAMRAVRTFGYFVSEPQPPNSLTDS